MKTFFSQDPNKLNRKLTALRERLPDILVAILLSIVMMLSMSLASYAQNVGINNPTPNAKALLDLTSTSKGFLAPRMTQVQRIAIFPAADATAAGMLVYQTDATIGFYYYDGTTWIYISNSAAAAGWGLTGNSGTTPVTNFLGTTDNQDLSIKTNNNPAVTITKNQRTRIGTPAPFLTLGTERLEIADSNGLKSDLVFVTGGGDPASKGYPQVVFDKSRNTNLAPAAVQNGDWTGVIVGRGYEGAGYVNNSAIIFGVDGAVSPGSVPGNIQFQTTGGSQNEKLRITKNGDIGIGTTTPWVRFEVEGNSVGVPVEYIRNQNTSGYSGTIFGSSAGGNFAHIGYANSTAPKWANMAYAGSIANIPYVLTTNDLERMRIDANGNVGIGTTTPTSKLDIAGSVKINDGTQGAGKVLVSDAAGLASWQTLSGASANAWGLTGNTGTTPVTNFVGTSDNQDLVFRSNNLERMRITANGDFGIGTTTPWVKFQVENNVAGVPTSIFRNQNASGYSGTIYESSAGANMAHFGYANPTAPAWANKAYAGSIANIPFVLTTNDIEQMRIDVNGNVGIGTTAPWLKLHVESNASGVPTEYLKNQNASGYSGTIFASSAGANMGHIGYANPTAPKWANLVYAGSIGAVPFVLSSNDQERMRIDVNGNIGIGTTTPTSKLEIAGSVKINDGTQGAGKVLVSDAAGLASWQTLSGAAANAWGLTGNTGTAPATNFVGTSDNQDLVFRSNNVERMRITANGDFGIGTTSPWVKFQVENNVAGVPTAIFRNQNASGYSGTLYESAAGANMAHFGYANPTAPAWANKVYAGSIANVPFVLTTNDIEQVRIDVNGNVGIGSAAPWLKLHVEGNASGVPVAYIKNQNAAGYSGTIFASSAGANMAHIGYGNPSAPAWANVMYAGSIGSVPFVFTTNDTERMRIDATGNVGIGTSTPTAQLEVNGYTKLGSSAPAVKMIKFTGTTAATQGGTVNIAHGLNATKILSVDVLVEYTPGNFVHASYNYNSGYEFNYFFNATNLTIANVSGNSSLVLSKPFKVLVTYEQ